MFKVSTHSTMENKITLEKILDTIDLRIHEGTNYEEIMKEFKANIKEWAISLLPNEVSYNPKDPWHSYADSPEAAESFNEALQQVRDTIAEETNAEFSS